MEKKKSGFVDHDYVQTQYLYAYAVDIVQPSYYIISKQELYLCNIYI